MQPISHDELAKISEKLGHPATEYPRDMEGWDNETDAPVVVLVHGHAVTKKSWTDPYQERLGEGLTNFDLALTDIENPPSKPFFPKSNLDWLSFSTPLRELPEHPDSMWEFLKRERFNLITWNQRDPNDTYRNGVEELEVILPVTRARFPGKPIVLVGHSRGGLVIRKYLQEQNGAEGVRKVILLGTPNRGSRLASWTDFLAKFVDVADWFLSPAYKQVKDRAGDKKEWIKKVAAHWVLFRDFVTGAAIAEMKPGSELIRSLRKGEGRESSLGIHYINLAGSSNVYTRLYRKEGQDYKRVYSFFDDFWDLFVPDELDDGEGDGLVSVARANLRWAPAVAFPVNHATFLIDEEIKARIRQECELLRESS